MNIKDILKKVKKIEIRTKKKTNENLMGQYHSAFKGQGMTFSEVRQYQFGDDIRRIDWNKTARFQEPYIKVMEEEREITIILLIDISSSMDYGTQNKLKKEFVAEICASIGFSTITNNDKIGMILFADKIYKIIPPQKGKKHVLSIINQILNVEHIPSNTNIDEVLRYTMNIFKKKSILFLFSDFHDEIKTKTLNIVAQKHNVLGIRIADDKDYNIPNIGYAEFWDAEKGKKTWVNTSSKQFQQQWKNNIDNIKRNTNLRFEEAAADIIDINTDTDYAKIFRQYFNRKTRI